MVNPQTTSPGSQSSRISTILPLSPGLLDSPPPELHVPPSCLFKSPPRQLPASSTARLSNLPFSQQRTSLTARVSKSSPFDCPPLRIPVSLTPHPVTCPSLQLVPASRSPCATTWICWRGTSCWPRHARATCLWGWRRAPSHSCPLTSSRKVGFRGCGGGGLRTVFVRLSGPCPCRPWGGAPACTPWGTAADLTWRLRHHNVVYTNFTTLLRYVMTTLHHAAPHCRPRIQ